MEIYILNSNYKKSFYVDEFESFIWTERYKSHGDFKLVTSDTKRHREIYTEGSVLTHDKTHIGMMIESVLREESANGGRSLVISGRALTTLFESRAVTPNLPGKLSWISGGNVGQLVARLVNSICVDGLGLSPNDVIPELYAHNSTTTSEFVSVSIEPKSLYTALKELCDSEDLGMRIQILEESPKLRFNVFEGVDRPKVVFSSTLDNITSESYLRSIGDYRNIAYVWGKDANKVEIVPARGVSVNITGLDRRVLHVDASDIDPTDITTADYTSQLKRRGLEALAEHEKVNLFDAQLTGLDDYTYDLDYYLGDRVYFMDEDGVRKTVRITEYIWAWDQEGLRSYPTFEAV